jgi:hypothetical protein
MIVGSVDSRIVEVHIRMCCHERVCFGVPIEDIGRPFDDFLTRPELNCENQKLLASNLLAEIAVFWSIERFVLTYDVSLFEFLVSGRGE